MTHEESEHVKNEQDRLLRLTHLNKIIADAGKRKSSILSDMHRYINVWSKLTKQNKREVPKQNLLVIHHGVTLGDFYPKPYHAANERAFDIVIGKGVPGSVVPTPLLLDKSEIKNNAALSQSSMMSLIELRPDPIHFHSVILN